MRILHILDHSPPLQSGYVFRTLAIVNHQRALGWDPVLLTSGKHYAPGPARERIGEPVLLSSAHSTPTAGTKGLPHSTSPNISRRGPRNCTIPDTASEFGSIGAIA